jgi:hypothetical protein
MERADDGIRTRDLRFTKPLLYQLSYVGVRAKVYTGQRMQQADLAGGRRAVGAKIFGTRQRVSLQDASDNDRPFSIAPLQRQNKRLPNFPQRDAFRRLM